MECADYDDAQASGSHPPEAPRTKRALLAGGKPASGSVPQVDSNCDSARRQVCLRLLSIAIAESNRGISAGCDPPAVFSGKARMANVIAIAVVQHAGRYLVGVRPEGTRFAGYAEFPGGKVEPGETPESAAVRECLEETGLRVEAGQRLHSVEDASAELHLHFIACRPASAEAEPTKPFRWVDLAELAACRFPPANARVVEQLLAQAPPPSS